MFANDPAKSCRVTGDHHVGNASCITEVGISNTHASYPEAQRRQLLTEKKVLVSEFRKAGDEPLLFHYSQVLRHRDHESPKRGVGTIGIQFGGFLLGERSGVLGKRTSTAYCQQ